MIEISVNERLCLFEADKWQSIYYWRRASAKKLEARGLMEPDPRKPDWASRLTDAGRNWLAEYKAKLSRDSS